MKMQKNIERFIELRIAGNSFDEIAKELQTSKQSLIEWNKKVEIRTAIVQGKAFKINSLVKAHNFDLENRLKSYLELAKKINDELLKRDLFKVPTTILLKMSIANENRLKEMVVNKSIEIGANPGILDFGYNEDGFFHLKLDE
jgi:hypothetical protein